MQLHYNYNTLLFDYRLQIIQHQMFDLADQSKCIVNDRTSIGFDTILLFICGQRVPIHYLF